MVGFLLYGWFLMEFDELLFFIVVVSVMWCFWFDDLYWVKNDKVRDYM